MTTKIRRIKKKGFSKTFIIIIAVILNIIFSLLMGYWSYIFFGSLILILMGLHGSLGAWLASDFGVHITADQLLVRGEDLNQIFQ